MPVDDHLHDDVVAGQRGARDPGVALVEAAHRVEEVRDRADAAVEGASASAAVASRVPERDDDAARVQLVDQLERAGQLGRERDVANAAGGEQAVGQRQVGSAAGTRADGRRHARARGTGPRGARRGRAARSARPGPRRATATSSASRAVISVGWNAVTPVSSIAAPARR